MIEQAHSIVFGNGHYGLVQNRDGTVGALLDGMVCERDVNGDHVVLVFAKDLEVARDALAALSVAVFGTEVAPGDVYAHQDRMLELMERVHEAQAGLPAYAASETASVPHAMVVRDRSGFFTLLQDWDGSLKSNRLGKPWKDLTGDGMAQALAYDVCEIRDLLERFRREVFFRGVAHERNVYADPDRLEEFRSDILRLLPDLKLPEVVRERSFAY